MRTTPSVDEPHAVVEHDLLDKVDDSNPRKLAHDEKNALVTPDGEEATDEEIQSLRHVADRIPFASWLVAGLSLTERFTYYGINSPFQNYVQNPPGDPVRPGGLGLGQARATNLNDGFQFIIYLSPVAWAIFADTKAGRYKTICIAVGVYLTGVIIIFATSTPAALHHNASLGGFLAGMITTGLGLGGLKACLPPFMVDQYTESKSIVKTLKSHERVVTDRALTTQSIYGVWYWYVWPNYKLSSIWDTNQVSIAFPVAWLCHSQINTNLVSQAAQMQTHGIPNDVFQNLSALTVILAMPLVQNLLYPLLRRLHIPHPPIYRITAGFFLQAGAMAYAAGVQKMIYNTGPCYDMPNKCLTPHSSPGPNHISVAIQIPAYVLDGLAGIFFYPTGQEYAYSKAPSSMKSLVQSILMVTVGLGAALAFALSPAYKDPTNTIMFATNWGAHIRWTGPQLMKQLPELNIFAMAMGTAGCITGTSTYLKSQKPSIKTLGVCNPVGDPIPGPRTLPLVEMCEFPWKTAVDAVENIGSVEAYRLSMLLSREGLICGPSSGMTLEGLFRFLSQAREAGTLHKYAEPGTGEVSCVFVCCDLPYQYIDGYYERLGEEDFPPIINKELIHLDTDEYSSAWELNSDDLPQFLHGDSAEAKGFVSWTTTPSQANRRDSKSTESQDSSLEIFDLRSAEDFQHGHVPGSISTPLAGLVETSGNPFESVTALEQQWKALKEKCATGEFSHLCAESSSDRFLLICYDGETSRLATAVMRARGINAYSVQGGAKRLGCLD
ncbi:hypothetical protein KCU99_g6465, partial [Aureobasidium melanogenum]